MNDPLDLPDDLAERAKDLLEFAPVNLWHSHALFELKKTPSSLGLIGIACSGGADSTFLLLMFFTAFPHLRERTVVLHYNHKLRKDDSNNDESFVRLLASQLELPFNVEFPKDKNSGSDEATLRQARMNFYKKLVKKDGITHILQGHNLDDIAETLLWRIPRAVSVDGLISPQAVNQIKPLTFLRPFVTITRKFIREALQKCSIPWREDSSNQENNYLRNRMRNSVLPKWIQASDRDLLQGVAKTVDLLSEDAKALEFYAENAFKECKAGEKLVLQSLIVLPPAIQRRVLIKWLHRIERKYPTSQKISTKARHLAKLLNHSDFTSLQLAENFTVRKKGKFIELVYADLLCPIPSVALPFDFLLHLPCGSSACAEKVRLDPKLLDKIRNKEVNPENEAYISATTLVNPLCLRSRKEGDTFTPLGAPGRKKLSDWMIDRKWTDSQKVRTPIFLNHQDKILWVPGFAPAEFVKVSDKDFWVIRLTYRRSNT